MRQEIQSQTGLRGVAALIVAIAHLDLSIWQPNFHELTQWLWRSWAAVDLFFMLSGFILAYTYVNPWNSPKALNWARFFRQRWARIYPLFFLTTLLMGLWPFLLTSPETRDLSNHTWHSILSQVFLVHALPQVGIRDAWNYPSWSISIEAFCYLLIFPLWFSLTRHLVKAGSWLVGTLILGLLGWEMFHLLSVHDPEVTPIYGWTALVRGVAGFSVGYLIYLWVNQAPHFQSFFVDRLGWMVVGSLALAYTVHHFDWSVWYLTLVLPGLLLGVSRDGTTWAHRVLASKPLHVLGLISYSLYLIHPLFYRAARFVLNKFGETYAPVNSWQNGVFHIVLLLGVLIASYFSYRWVELPLKKCFAPRRAKLRQD